MIHNITDRPSGVVPCTTLALAVLRGLLDGFGVEDIALREGLPVEAVRAEVQRLRAEGSLVHICRAARQEGRAER